MRAYSLLPLLAASAPLAIDYRVTNPHTLEESKWNEYAKTDVVFPRAETFTKEYDTAKVVKTLHGNGRALASLIWDLYEPQPSERSPKLQWRLSYNESKPSITSLPLARVTSEKQLGKILSNLEVHLLVDTDTFISGNIRVPWEYLDDMEASISRLGTVYVMRPQPASLVVEEPPKVKSRAALSEEEWNIKPQAEPSFWRKYWWIFLVGYFLVSTLSAQPEAAETAAPQPPASTARAPAVNARSKGGNKRH